MLRKLLVNFAFFVVVGTGYFAVTRFDSYAITSDIVAPEVEVAATNKIEVIAALTPKPTVEPENVVEEQSPNPIHTPKPEVTEEVTIAPDTYPDESTPKPTVVPAGNATEKPAATAAPANPTVAPVTKLTTAPTIAPTAAPTAEPVSNPDVTDPDIQSASATNGYITAAILTNEDCMYLLYLDGTNVEQGSLTNDGMWNKIPLVHGDGTYRILIGEYVDGYFYQKAETTVTYTETDPFAVYLQSTSQVPYSDSDSYVQKAKELTAGLSSNDDKAYAIYQWVISNITYNNDLIGTAGRNPTITVNNRNGICLDFAELYAAMCRSVGVACAVTTGYYDNVNGYHAWNQFKNNSGTWSTVDASSDSQYRAMGSPYEFKKDPSQFERVSRY